MPDLIEFHPFSSKEVQYRKEITSLRKRVSEQDRKITQMMQSDHEQEKLALRRQVDEMRLSVAGSDRKLTQVLQQLRELQAQQTESPKQPIPVVRKERLL